MKFLIYIFVLDLLLSQVLPLADLLVKLPSRHIIHYKDKAFLFLIHLVDIDNARVIEQRQYLDLMAGLHNEGLVYFGCKHLFRLLMDDLANCRLGTIYLTFTLRPSTYLSS